MLIGLQWPWVRSGIAPVPLLWRSGQGLCRVRVHSRCQIGYSGQMGRNSEFEGAITNRPKAVIFDMDGTLADVSGLRHYVQGGPGNNYKKDFDSFHSESAAAPPNQDVVNMARQFDQSGHKVVVVTARSARYRPHTAFWLADNHVPSDAMYMRPDGDHRPDYEVKKDILGRINRSYDVVHAVDDNPNVLKLWHEHGIPTTRVPGWND